MQEISIKNTSTLFAAVLTQYGPYKGIKWLHAMCAVGRNQTKMACNKMTRLHKIIYEETSFTLPQKNEEILFSQEQHSLTETQIGW